MADWAFCVTRATSCVHVEPEPGTGSVPEPVPILVESCDSVVRKSQTLYAPLRLATTAALYARPGLSARASVNAPFLWPNSSLSIRPSGSAARLTPTNAPAARVEL